MNKIILISILLVFTSCDKKVETKNLAQLATSKTEKVEAEDKVNNQVADNSLGSVDLQASTARDNKVQQAKELIDEVNSIVKKGILKQLNISEVNDKINPLMNKYENLIGKLSPQEKKEVEEYRMLEMSKVVDLQVENSK